MIGFLRGTLLRRSLPAVLVDVGGVGYEVRTSLATLEALPPEGSAVELEVLTLFRNEALELYGFLHPDEKAVFSALLGVSGVGPKIALSLLSTLALGDLVGAVRDERAQALERVPGVGRKTAQRLVLELKDKFRDWVSARPERTAGKPTTLAEDAVAALENLGYRRAEAENAIARVAGDASPGDIAALIRRALRELGAAR